MQDVQAGQELADPRVAHLVRCYVTWANVLAASVSGRD